MNKDIRLQISEIFVSLQGESTYVGIPCSFVRLAGCDLHCAWCDTGYARTSEREMSIPEVLDEVGQYGTRLILVTGGEPLLQDGCLDLLSSLCAKGYSVLLETGGHRDITPVDDRVVIILDVKCPSSGESERNRYENISHLRPSDEVKFVIADRTDYDWAKATIERLDLSGRCKVLFSPVSERLEPHTLAEWVLEDRLPVRFQLQLHKILWPDRKRGV